MTNSLTMHISLLNQRIKKLCAKLIKSTTEEVIVYYVLVVPILPIRQIPGKIPRSKTSYDVFLLKPFKMY